MSEIEKKRQELEKYGLDKTFMLGVSLAQKEFLLFLTHNYPLDRISQQDKINELNKELKKVVEK